MGMGGRNRCIIERMEEAPENGKESSHYAHSNGKNEGMNVGMSSACRKNG